MTARNAWAQLVRKTKHKGGPQAPRGKWEEALFLQMKLYAAEPPLRQYEFAKPTRKFRADFCWPARKLVVEVEGQIHSIRNQRERDIERRQWCHFNGWTVLPVSNKQVKSGEAIEVVLRALKGA